MLIAYSQLAGVLVKALLHADRFKNDPAFMSLRFHFWFFDYKFILCALHFSMDIIIIFYECMQFYVFETYIYFYYYKTVVLNLFNYFLSLSNSYLMIVVSYVNFLL